MRAPILLLCSAFFLQGIHAETLSDADREALLDNLEKLKESVDSKSGTKLRTAISAFRAAMGSDDAAKELYLNCTKRVSFDEQQRKAQDFREWERRESERFSEPGFASALRIQLRWLVLTLEAAPEKADRVKLREEAQQIVDGIFANAEKLKGQEGMLTQPVTSTIFARAYEVNQIKVDNWPLAPAQLDTIYSQLLLPPLRTPQRLAELRSTWVKRIQQESTKAEFWPRGGGQQGGGGGRGGDREDRRGGGQDTAQAVEYAKFLQDTLPKLQWDMEVDLFRHGDESGASVRMLALLQKNIAHPSAREWGEQFKNLLKPAPTVPLNTENATTP